MSPRAPELDAALARSERPDVSDYLTRVAEERAGVLADFPLEAWPELPLERYAMGTESPQAPYCTVLEYRTPHLGSIKGGSAHKHIIYRTNTGEWWRAGPLDDLEIGEGWRQLRGEFVAALHAVRNGDLADLDALPLLRWGQALVTKTLAIYAPDKFLRVYSGEHIRGFIRLFGGTPLPGAPSWELNRQLKELIEKDSAVSAWDQEEVLQFLYTKMDPRPSGEQIFKIAPGENARLWDECFRDGVIRVGFETGDLSQYTSVEALMNRLHEIDPTKKEPHLKGLARQLLRFRDREPGTRIVANRGTSEILAVGTVNDEGYRYAPELDEYSNVLGVDWDTSYSQRLETPVRGWVSTFGNVSPSLWRTIQQGRHSRTGGADEPGEPEPPRPVLPPDVSQVLDALKRKGQVILHGPPGTGKTRLALNAALALMHRESALTADRAERSAALDDLMSSVASASKTDAMPRVTMSTFHPSLGYEDFVEGYKPRPNAQGGLSLECTDGLFHRLCTAATDDPEHTYLLVIDEINRADLPRVLGELVTLLELDKRGICVELPVSGRKFRVPGNIRIIGTMNTADRSVAHLDAAIRRRFGFVPVPPDPAAVAANVGALALSSFLTQLNHRLSVHLDRDLQIGHAFLLSEDMPLDSPEELHAAFYHDIVPLLEDYALGDDDLLTRLLGTELVVSGQVVVLSPEDLTVTLAKEFDAGINTDAEPA